MAGDRENQHGSHRHADVGSQFEPSDARYLTGALALIALFLVGELVAAVLGRSLALFADAGHMLTDVIGLAGSIWALRLVARPETEKWTFGLKRAEIISGAVNGVFLAAIAIVITVEAVMRLLHPTVVHGAVVVVVAGIGAVVNIAAATLLSRADRTSLNIRGAWAHVVTDLYAFIGTAIAGVVILVSHFERADTIASLVVVLLITRSAWSLLKDSGKILLEAAPEHVDLGVVRSHLLALDHVLDVHDLHAWTVASGLPTVSAHVVIEDGCFATGSAPQLLDRLQECLAEHFDVEHATFQLEPGSHALHEKGAHA